MVRRTVAIVVCVAVLASGCTSSGGAKATAPLSSATRTTLGAAATTSAPAVAAPAAAAQQVGSVSVVGALAGVGVATVANETSSAPEAPVSGPVVFTLTAWQVANLQGAAADQQGISGADLNTMLPMPAQSPQLDDIVGGWVLERGDAASIAAGSLLGGQGWAHPEQVVFPVAVLTLFMADYLQHASSPSVSPSGSASSAHASGTAWRGGYVAVQDVDLVSAPCSAVQGFVDMVLDKMFALLKVNPADVSSYLSGKIGGVVGAVVGTVGGFIASFWNHAVDLAEQAVKNVLKALTQPILTIIAAVIGGLGIITTIVSYLKVWKLPVTADPALNRFSVDPAGPRSGAFTVAVDPDAEITDWPTQMVDCANVIKVKLPTLSRAGAPVTWTIGGDPGAATSTQLTGSLDTDLKQTMTYQTGHESAKLAATGAIEGLSLEVTVKVRRTEVDQLRDLVEGYVIGQLPDIAAPVVRPILDTYLSWALSFLDILTAVTGHDTIVVTHHVPKPSPSPSPTPSGCSSGTTGPIPAGTYTGPITATLISALHLPQDPGKYGSPGGGTATVVGMVTLVSDGATVKGTIHAAGSSNSHVGLKDSVTVVSIGSGSLNGTISGPATGPVVKGTLASSEAAPTPFTSGLHLTRIGCGAISGDLVAMYAEIAKPVATYITITGSGAWTAPRKG